MIYNRIPKKLFISTYYKFREYFLNNIKSDNRLFKKDDPAIIVCEYMFACLLENTEYVGKECNNINDYMDNTIGPTGPSSHHVLKLLYRKLNIEQEQLLLHYSVKHEVMKGDFALVRDYVHYLGLYN